MAIPSVRTACTAWALAALCAACAQQSSSPTDASSGGGDCTPASSAPGCVSSRMDGGAVTGMDGGVVVSADGAPVTTTDAPPGSDATAAMPDGTGTVSPGGPAVWTHHMDNQRTGAYLAETTLTSANITPDGFGLLVSRPVDGQIYAQPLYVPGVAIAGAGMRNVVYVATMHNSVYAFDADDTARAEPLWQVNLGPSVPNTAVDNCVDITPEVGILATPVIDLASRTLYVSAKTMESGAAHFRLHALELETGHEKFGGPVEISGSIAGTGNNGEGGAEGRITFHALNLLQRPALTLANGVVYIGFGGWCDRDVFHGWVMAYDAATLHQRGVYADTRNGYNGGIWQSGAGFAADEHGDVYLETGDGHFDGAMSPPDLGNSLVRLHLSGTSLEATDWFTPSAQAWLDEHDYDLGSTGPMLLPGTNLVLGGSKQGMFYLLDRDRLGRYSAAGDMGAVQSLLASYSMSFGHIHGVPVYWNGPMGPRLYVWPEDDVLRMYHFDGSRIDTAAAAVSPIMVPSAAPGGFLTLSASGSAAGSGVLWALAASQPSADVNVRPGALRAFDATTLRQLWNSDMNPSRDALGTAAKYAPPMVAGGRVYAPTASNRLQIYGLLH